MKKIYLNQNSTNCDELCLELLQKLNEIETEVEALEVIAPVNPFSNINISMKAKVAKRLLELRVKFVIRVSDYDNK